MLVAPGGDDVDGRIERDEGQFKSDLVVALSGGAVRYGIRAFEMSDLNLALGNERPGQRRAQQIRSFVNRVGAQRRKDEVAGEFLLQVVDVDFAGAGAEGLFLQPGKFLLLSHVGREADHLAFIRFDQPADDDGSVQTAGIRQYNFFNFICHDIFSS